MTVKEMQAVVDGWINKVGVRYFDPMTNTLQLVEEVGELARVVSRTYGEQSFKEGEEANLADELTDVLWVVLCLANQHGIDLEEELVRNLAKKTSRDIDRHKNNKKLTDR